MPRNARQLATPSRCTRVAARHVGRRGCPRGSRRLANRGAAHAHRPRRGEVHHHGSSASGVPREWFPGARASSVFSAGRRGGTRSFQLSALKSPFTIDEQRLRVRRSRMRAARRIRAGGCARRRVGKAGAENVPAAPTKERRPSSGGSAGVDTAVAGGATGPGSAASRRRRRRLNRGPLPHPQEGPRGVGASRRGRVFFAHPRRATRSPRWARARLRRRRDRHGRGPTTSSGAQGARCLHDADRRFARQGFTSGVARWRGAFSSSSKRGARRGCGAAADPFRLFRVVDGDGARAGTTLAEDTLKLRPSREAHDVGACPTPRSRPGPCFV